MQKYKLYINEKPLILTGTASLPFVERVGDNTLDTPYTGKKKTLFQYIDTLEKSGPYSQIIIHADDFVKLKNDLKSIYQPVKASGGIVLNPSGEVLFIFRRGFWDLPKGKVDEGESRKKAAVREVMEETGLTRIKSGPKLTRTRHAYRNSKGNRLLKISDWYLMHAAREELHPQFEEDIELAEWYHPVRFLKTSPRMYQSIKDVLAAYFEYSLAKI